MRMSEALKGYRITKIAEGYADTTIKNTSRRLKMLFDWLEDPEIEDVRANDLKNFIYYLRTEYKPKRFSGDMAKLTESSVHGYWKAMRSFWKFINEEFEYENVALKLKAPRYTNRPITPLTQAEVKKLLKACDKDRMGHIRNTRFRDRAIIMVLMDTGTRLGEMLRLNAQDVDLETGRIHIRPYGRGIKSKGRMVYIGAATRKALWKHLSQSEIDQLFNISPAALSILMRRLGKKINVHATVQKFRHTFAINYLRNGGDVFTLQRLLGHSTLDMVKKYLAIAQVDLETAHRMASPVDRWGL